ncbi:MAG: hypothetical protein H6702_20395 [Myxococcales bacterium]|nr:hypothetical protein [Myxococcales bacterium]
MWRLRVLALLLAGCVEPTAVLEPGRGADAGRVDAAASLDAGAQPDRGAGMARDLGPADVLVPDRGAVDVGVWDLGLLDAALPDGEARDSAVADRDLPDAGAPDLEPFDGGPPDGGPPDEGPPDPDPPLCEPLPAACGPVTPQAAQEHHLQPLDGCAFALRRTGDVAAAQAVADALAERTGGPRDLLEVLGDLNRQGVPGVGAAAADRLRNHDYGGVRWNAGDVDTDAWYPQGITGADDAFADGHPRRLLLVSWYDHADDGVEKGSRISLLDLTDADDPRYRHLLLVTPQGTPQAPDFGPLLYDGGGSLHAGGVVWWHPWLYVADTTQGLRVFDLTRVIRVSHVDDGARIGVDGARMDAHAYRYAVPQVARYQLAPGGCAVRFSFVGLDRSEDPPVLVTGEYHRDDVLGRVVRWPLDPATGWLAADARGQVRALDAAVAAQSRMQGALTWQGDTYLSCSSQTSGLGRLYRTRAGLESRVTAWPRGCEDLYLERHTDRIWTVTEYPGDRDVVGIPRRAP